MKIWVFRVEGEKINFWSEDVANETWVELLHVLTLGESKGYKDLEILWKVISKINFQSPAEEAEEPCFLSSGNTQSYFNIRGFINFLCNTV